MTTRQRPNGSTSSGTTATSSPNIDTRGPPTPTTPSTRFKDEAIKARIIKHMNAEHKESLGLYLRFYSGLAAKEAEEPRLVDMSYTSLTIESHSASTHTIPIDPPMTSWSDARPRVVAMDRDARAGLRLPPLPSSDEREHEHERSPLIQSDGSSASRAQPVVVRAYDPPTAPFHLFVIALVIWFYSGYFALRNGSLGPGTWYWEHVMAWFPVGGAEGYRWLNLKLGIPVVVVHGAEAGFMAWRLSGYGVRPWGVGMGLWWMWVGSTFLEGGGAHQRLGVVVRRGGGGRGSQ